MKIDQVEILGLQIGLTMIGRGEDIREDIEVKIIIKTPICLTMYKMRVIWGVIPLISQVKIAIDSITLQMVP